MPQMAPISWLTMFTVFSISFLIFNILMYFSFTPRPNLTKKVKVTLSNSMNWKW